MAQSRNPAPLFVSIGLAMLAAALLSLVVLGDVVQQLVGVIAMIAGAVTFTALYAITRYFEQEPTPSFIEIEFDDGRLRQELREMYRVTVADAKTTDAWEPTSDRLLLQDPNLALAKVRIDLEREIRRIGVERGVIRPDQRVDLRRILDMYETTDVLPSSVTAAIKDLLPICNAAVHGKEVSIETASRVVDMAAEVMTVLRASPILEERSLSP
jgi:hypothetical protein